MVSLLTDIEKSISGAARGDRSDPYKFVAIGQNRSPRRVVVVDGGSGRLKAAPNFSITLNRVYASLFRGRTREKSGPRVEFFSTTTIRVAQGRAGRVVYDTRLYPQKPECARYLPDEADLRLARSYPRFRDLGQVDTIARSFAEWTMASCVVESDLGSGDILIKDGSLQTEFRRESSYASGLYESATKAGVVVCGLSKTSAMLTKSGAPLLAEVEELSKEFRHDSWYAVVPSQAASPLARIMALVVKFHPRSEFVFKLEMLRDQFRRMGKSGVEDVLSSISANSDDLSMVGYPYAAIDADKFAQVRTEDVRMYKGMLMSQTARMPGLDRARMQRYYNALRAHDRLNEVTG